MIHKYFTTFMSQFVWDRSARKLFI